MPISVNCPSCGKKHKAPEKLAGRTLACLACGKPLTIPPLSDAEDASEYLLKNEDPPPPPQRIVPTKPTERPVQGVAKPVEPKRKNATKSAVDVAPLPPLTANEPPLWLRHLHWLLILALIPLAVSLLSTGGDDEDIVQRIAVTMGKANEADQERIEQMIENARSLDDLFRLIPGERLHGAMLARSSSAHWGIAAAAAVLFLAFMMFLAWDGSANPFHVLVVGLCTATIGIGFLFTVQAIASWTEGRVFIGRGIITLFFYIFKFIAFSYNAADDPENGFLLSFLGYTAGVGFCEELVKALPVFFFRGEENGKNWRGMFIWGLASGAGFGIAEGILYSSRYYNGIHGIGIYAVRFLSCVALHAIWTGSVAITIYLNRQMFYRLDTWHEWIGPVLFVLGVPMILHGLYDTCLKKDYNGAALVVAIASFGYLAFLNSRLYSVDDEEANKAMLREYKRRRDAIN